MSQTFLTFFYSSLNSAKLSCSSEVTLILLHIMKKAVQNPSLISWAMIDDITRFLTCDNISLPRPGVSNFFFVFKNINLCVLHFLSTAILKTHYLLNSCPISVRVSACLSTFEIWGLKVYKMQTLRRVETGIDRVKIWTKNVVTSFTCYY